MISCLSAPMHNLLFFSGLLQLRLVRPRVVLELKIFDFQMKTEERAIRVFPTIK